MKKTFQNITAFLFFAFVSFSVFAEENQAKQILTKMSDAMDNLDYEIAFVQSNTLDMESFRLRHTKEDYKTFAQLVALDGVQREIIQLDNLVSYFQPDFAAFTIQSSEIVDALPALMRANFDQLSESYEFISLAKNRIAGRLVNTVRVVPKDDFRYQFVAFIDVETSLLLGSDMIDRDGNLLEQFRVVTMYINEELKGLTKYLNKITLPPLLDEGKQHIKDVSLSWQTGWQPLGFHLIRQNQYMVNELGLVESGLFSDGLFTFQLYVTPSDNVPSPEYPWKQGALTIYSETKGDKEITLIGQLPVATAKRIVKEVKFNRN